MDYSFTADLLNKFSQLTPWVQAIITIGICGSITGIGYFAKESIIAIMRPFYRSEEKPDRNEKIKESPQLPDKCYTEMQETI